MIDHTSVAGADIKVDDERERTAASRPTLGLLRPLGGGQSLVAILLSRDCCSTYHMIRYLVEGRSAHIWQLRLLTFIWSLSSMMLYM